MMSKLSSFLFTNIASLPPTYSAEIRVYKQSILANIGIEKFSSQIILHFKTFYNGKIVQEKKSEIDVHDKTSEVITYSSDCPKYVKESELSFIEIDVYSKSNELIFSNRGLHIAYIFFYSKTSKSYLTELVLKYGHPNIISQYKFFDTFVFTSPNIFINKKKDFCDVLAVVNPYEKNILVTVTTHDNRKIKHIAKARSGSKIFLDQLLTKNEMEWKGCIHITGNNRIIVNLLKTSFSDKNIIYDCEHPDYYMPINNYVGMFKYIRTKIANYLFTKGILKRVRKNI